MPLPPPRAGLEGQMVGLGEHVADDIAHQPRQRRLARQVAAAPHDAVAGAMLERDAPLPSRIVRGRARERHRRADVGGLHRDGAVARQPVRPVVVAGVERALDQQRAEAGAVEEQVARDPLPALERQRGDVAALAVQLDRRDLPLDPAYAVAFRHAAQEGGVERAVELIGVVDPVARQVRELPRLRRAQLQAVIVVGPGVALCAGVQPEMLEAGGPVILAGRAEGVEVAAVGCLPPVEADAQLERRLGGAHELRLVDAEQAVVRHERRDRALADADGADRLRFDQRHLHRAPHRARDGGGGHPAGGASPGNDDAAEQGAADAVVGHRLNCCRRKPRMRAALSGVSGASTLRPSAGMCAAAASASPKT